MSLINKVLRDLDARTIERAPPLAIGAALNQGLRPVSVRRPMGKRAAVVAGVAVLAYAAISYWITPLPGASLVRQWLASSVAPEANTPTRMAAAPAVPETVPLAETAETLPPSPPAPAPVTPAPKPRPVAKQPPPVKAASARPDTSASKPVARARTITGASGPVTSAAVNKEVQQLSPVQMAENAYREGAARLNEGRRSEAERALRRAINYSPAHSKARELLATLLIAGGQTADAAQILEAGIKTSPDVPAMYMLLARIYADRGQDDKAIRVLESARQPAANDPELIALQAVLYQRAARHADAIAAFRKALAVNPGEGRWWAGLGISLEAAGDKPGATAAYQRALGARIDARLADYAKQRLAALGGAGR